MVLLGVKKAENLLELLDGEVVFGDALDDGESEIAIVDMVFIQVLCVSDL